MAVKTINIKQITSSKKVVSKKKRSFDSYSPYIYKVLKQVHPDLSVSKKGMSVMNNLVKNIFDRIVQEAAVIVKKDKKQTMCGNCIKTSLKFVFGGQEIYHHAWSQAMKAITMIGCCFPSHAKYEAFFERRKEELRERGYTEEQLKKMSKIDIMHSPNL